MGSADWRHRNMHERVEAVVPIKLPSLKERLTFVLTEALKDNRLAWDMHADGSYNQRQPANNEKERNFHLQMMENAKKRALD